MDSDSKLLIGGAVLLVAGLLRPAAVKIRNMQGNIFSGRTKGPVFMNYNASNQERPEAASKVQFKDVLSIMIAVIGLILSAIGLAHTLLGRP